MYILYMDESGVEELACPPAHFVLLGVMIPAVSWKEIVGKLEDVKSTYDLRDVEIHSAWMHRRYSEQESIPGFDQLGRLERRTQVENEIRKKSGIIGVRGTKRKVESYRREVRSIRPYIHLTNRERLNCLQALASKLTEYPSVRIFADAISKPDFTPGVHATPYEMAFEQVLSRGQAFLSTQNELGILVSDNNSKAAPRLTNLSRKFHAQGTFYRLIPNIVETPLFVDSALTSMIQIADLCAFGLRRFIENKEEMLWNVLEPLGDMKNGICVGVRHFTGKRGCGCRICVAHGRRSCM
jgi:hypothetical protein